MDSMQPNMQNEEVEINLVELLYHLLTKWRVYVVLVIVGVALGLGVTTYNTNTLGKNFEDEQIRRIEKLATINEIYERQKQYNEGSPMQYMDASNVYSGTLQYYVTAANEDLDRIVQEFELLVQDEAVLSLLHQKAELSCNERYVRQLVSAGHSNVGEYNLQLSSVEEARNMPRSATVSFYVTGSTRAKCSTMMSVLKEQVAMTDELLKEQFVGYSLESVSERVTLNYRGDVDDHKLNLILAEDAHVEQVKELTDEMSDDELEYYTVHYPQKDKEQPNPVVRFIIRAVKLSIIVSILLLFVAAAYYAVTFLLDGRLRRAENVREQLGLHLIANVQGKEVAKRKGIDAWLYGLFNKDAAPINSQVFLLEALKAFDAKSMLICGNAEEADIREWMDVIGQNAACQCTGFLHQDEQAQKSAAQAQGVVLVAKLGKTTKTQMLREIEICHVLKRPILGVITIQ